MGSWQRKTLIFQFYPDPFGTPGVYPWADVTSDKFSVDQQMVSKLFRVSLVYSYNNPTYKAQFLLNVLSVF